MNNLKTILHEVLDCEIHDDISSKNCEEWDSLNHVNIILELQDFYKIKIPSKDIDELKSLQAIKEYLIFKGINIS